MKRIISTVCLLLCLTLCLMGCDEAKDEDIYKDIVNNNAVQAGNVGDGSEFESTSKGSGKRVAITFDDGPHNVRTREIVDELNSYGYSATFFVVGNRIDGSEYNGRETLKYVIDGGHEVGIHGYTHSVYYNKCSDSEYAYELSSTLNAIKDTSEDCSVTLMRPIGGAITEERVNSCDYSVILWNVDSEDWKFKYAKGDSEAEAADKVNTIVENVMSSVDDGSIILMHDIYESTYDALKIILKRLHDEGYDVVTVSELLGNPKAGVKYMAKAR